MFFGAGRKNIGKRLTDGRTVILNYGYFHFMLLRTALSYRYTLAAPSSEGWVYKDITKEEATQLLNGQLLQVHWRRRFGLYIFLVSLAITITIGVLSNPHNFD